MFSGMSSHSIDSKGRIVLPAKFREELGESFFIAQGFGNCCAQILSKEQFEELSQKIMELPADMAMMLQYTFTATAVETSPNAQGRVMIPRSLRDFAKLEGEALVIGMGNRIEVWSKEKFDEFMESRRDVINEALHLLRF